MAQAARKVTAKDANEKLAHRRLTVLELAERLGNVAEEVEGEDHEDDGDDGEHEPGVERDDVDVLTAGSLDRQSGQK